MKNVIIFAICALGLALLDGAGVPQDSRQNIGSDGEFRHILKIDEVTFEDWKSRWRKEITQHPPTQYCDSAMGEEVGWLLRPYLSGYYYGYVLTGDSSWIDLLDDCVDALIKRAVKEPDGYLGWPKLGAAGTDVDHLDDFFADSLVGEATALTPVVQMSTKIIRTPGLSEKYGARAEGYIGFSKEIFEKWNSRGSWREAQGGGMISVVLPFGMVSGRGAWTPGYDKRHDPSIGFSHPDNKANLVACWLLAMTDATNNPIFRQRAEGWFRLMKSRMTPSEYGSYRIWNYWQPAGSWDYKYLGIPKHWVGVHPNGAYYDIDVESIVNAYEHGLVFDQENIKRLIATSLTEKRAWHALVPYDEVIRKEFEASHRPDSWAGLSVTPWYLALSSQAQDHNP